MQQQPTIQQVVLETAQTIAKKHPQFRASHVAEELRQEFTYDQVNGALLWLARKGKIETFMKGAPGCPAVYRLPVAKTTTAEATDFLEPRPVSYYSLGKAVADEILRLRKQLNVEREDNDRLQQELRECQEHIAVLTERINKFKQQSAVVVDLKDLGIQL